MANVLHRTTKEYRKSVNTPDFPVEDWIINPDLSAVDGVDKSWWVIVGDTVREATTTEKNANLAAYKAEVKRIGEQSLNAYLGPDNAEFDRIHSQGNATANTTIQPYITWRDTVYAGMATVLSSLNDAADVATVDAIRASFDLSVFDATRPTIEPIEALEARYGVG